jgi:hypothetical protein
MLNANGEPKRDSAGNIRYARNGRKAKSGLSKSIQASCWGQSWTFLCYKALKKGKLAFVCQQKIPRWSVPNVATLARRTDLNVRFSSAKNVSTETTPMSTRRV